MDQIGRNIKIQGVCYGTRWRDYDRPPVMLPVYDDSDHLLGFGNCVWYKKPWYFTPYNEDHCPVYECFIDYNSPARLDLDNGEPYYLEAAWVDPNEGVQALRLVQYGLIGFGAQPVYRVFAYVD